MHCTHTVESTNAKVRNILHGRNNITCSTNCKYRTATTLYRRNMVCLRYVIVGTVHKGGGGDGMTIIIIICWVSNTYFLGLYLQVQGNLHYRSLMITLYHILYVWSVGPYLQVLHSPSQSLVLFHSFDFTFYLI